MDYTKTGIENTNRKTLIEELRELALNPLKGGAVDKQKAEMIIMWLRYQDEKITKNEYEGYWKKLTENTKRFLNTI